MRDAEHIEGAADEIFRQRQEVGAEPQNTE